MRTMAVAFDMARRSGIPEFFRKIRFQLDVGYPDGSEDYMYVEHLFEDGSFRWNEGPIGKNNCGTSTKYFAGNCLVRKVSLHRTLVRGITIHFESEHGW